MTLIRPVWPTAPPTSSFPSSRRGRSACGLGRRLGLCGIHVLGNDAELLDADKLSMETLTSAPDHENVGGKEVRHKDDSLFTYLRAEELTRLLSVAPQI